VIVNLGREDCLDRVGLARLVDSINRYLGTGESSTGADAVVGDPLTVSGARSMGTVWLLDGLWRRLDIAGALRTALGGRRFTADVERILFALVANRAVDPMSKLSAAEWVTLDTVVSGLTGMDEDQAYRAMDVLVDADVEAGVQETVFFSVANLLNLEVDVILFDTTSTYWERDTEDDVGGLRRYGHSKDHRDDLPQIVIGLAVTKEGIPVRCWCWPGNTTDMTVLHEVRDGMRAWKLGRVVTVTDRGFSSEDNLGYLRRGGGHYIAGERMRAGLPLVEQALASPGRYREVADNLKVKEIRLDDAPDRKWVLCLNPVEAARDRMKREQAIETVETELIRIDKMRLHGVGKKNQDATAHEKAECALRKHPALGRWVKQLANGRLTVDKAKAKQEARLDGKFLIVTSDLSLSAEDVALGFKNLLVVERGFKDMKTGLELRPVYHRLEHRIRAHVLLCWLALLLTRIAEQSTGLAWRRISTELDRLHLVHLTGPAGQVGHTTSLTTLQSEILSACQVTPPPAITHLDPV
jgi:transposase